MNTKGKMIYFFQELLGIGIAGILCFLIYRWGAGHEKACFAITIGTTAYLILCFYNAISKNKNERMAEKVLSGLTIVAFSNEFYNYNKIIAVFPVFANTDRMFFSLIVVGTSLLLFIIIKIITSISKNIDADSSQSPKYNSTSISADNTERYITGDDIWIIICFMFLIIVIVATGWGFLLSYTIIKF